MTRALRFLALFTALFVVAVRSLGGFPLVAECGALMVSGASELCPASDEPREEDTLAPVTMDDSDDSVDALITPAPVRVRLLTYREPSAAECGVLAEERALPSHAPSLDRPPRA